MAIYGIVLEESLQFLDLEIYAEQIVNAYTELHYVLYNEISSFNSFFPSRALDKELGLDEFQIAVM